MKALDTFQTGEGTPDARKGILWAAACTGRRRCSIATTT